jgi:hypothetical protein
VRSDILFITSAFAGARIRASALNGAPKKFPRSFAVPPSLAVALDRPAAPSRTAATASAHASATATATAIPEPRVRAPIRLARRTSATRSSSTPFASRARDSVPYAVDAPRAISPVAGSSLDIFARRRSRARASRCAARVARAPRARS